MCLLRERKKHMPKHLPSVTIGIAAYNEAANIAVLLYSLVEQAQNTYTLKNIIVISDGSTDDTVAMAKSVANKKITIINDNKRNGQPARQNELFAASTTDIVVLLDADIVPVNAQFVDQIITPLLNDDTVGLVGAKVLPAPAQTFVGRMLAWHHTWKQTLYESHPEHEIYLCHGRARAFSKALYTQLRWPPVLAEDAYSYLATKQQGLRFVFQPTAQVYFQPPSHIRDQHAQSARFLVSQKELEKYFSPATVQHEYAFSKQLLLQHLLVGFTKKPLFTFVYLLMHFGTRLIHTTAPIQTNKKGIWEPSVSTKRVAAPSRLRVTRQ